MPRTCRYEAVLDASLFTPAQLQPVALGRLGFQAGTRWLRDHVCSHRTLVAKHQVGLVLWAWELEYGEPLRFADADEVTVEATARVRGPRSSQLEAEMTVRGPSGVAARTRATSVPLRLSGDQALSGTPARLPDSVLGSFHPDELALSPYRSAIPALRADLAREGVPLAAGTTSFRVHRHHCEVADQWYWAETLGFAGGAREELVMRHGGGVPELRRALSGAIRRIDVTWLRAGQFWDLLQVRTTAHRYGAELVFVHELGLAEDAGGTPYAMVVERI